MTQWAWHVHDQVLVEPLTEPILNRIVYIKAYKSKGEQALRLELLKLVQGQLPSSLLAAWEKANAEWKKADAEWKKAYAARKKAYAARKPTDAEKKAYAAWKKADAASWKAYAEWEKAYAEYTPELEEIHRQECPDCLWDGTTIFPQEAE